MSLHIVHRDQEGIEILDLRGHLVFGPGNLRLQEELDQIVTAGKSCVVINVSDVSEMDDEALSALMFASARLRKAGGGLALVDLKPSHIEDVVAARLRPGSELLKEVFQHEQDAIDSFFPGRRVQRYDILEYIRSTQRSMD
jgi:anti-anti-sigma regulatory factor